jgi:hypothetical protein
MGDAAVTLDMRRFDHQETAPEFASIPRCVMCQLLPTPSSALY